MCTSKTLYERTCCIPSKLSPSRLRHEVSISTPKRYSPVCMYSYILKARSFPLYDKVDHTPFFSLPFSNRQKLDDSSKSDAYFVFSPSAFLLVPSLISVHPSPSPSTFTLYTFFSYSRTSRCNADGDWVHWKRKERIYTRRIDWYTQGLFSRLRIHFGANTLVLHFAYREIHSTATRTSGHCPAGRQIRATIAARSATDFLALRVNLQPLSL